MNVVHRYKMGGAVIASNYELTEMSAGPRPSPHEPVDLTITLDESPDPVWLDDGVVVSSTHDVELRRAGNRFVLDLHDSVMDLSADGRTLRAWASPGLDQNAFRHALLDVAIPYALSLQGRTVLHATAVALEGSAVAFIGHSGQGKSTLAAAVACRADAMLLADDCLCVADLGGTFVVEPSYPGMRLRPDSLHATFGRHGTADVGASSKKLIAPSAVTYSAALATVPLVALVLLDPQNDVCAPQLIRLGRAEAYMAVVRHRLQLDVGEGLHGSLLERFATLVDHVPTFRLRFVPAFESLGETVAAVVGAVRDAASSRG